MTQIQLSFSHFSGGFASSAAVIFFVSPPLASQSRFDGPELGLGARYI